MNWKGWLVIVLIVAGGAVTAAITLKGKSGQQAREGAREGAEKVREAAVPGLFYPEEKDALQAMVDTFLSKVDQQPLSNVRGLVCPHAGYRFSGQTAAYAYKQLVGRPIHTVVVMGPSHTAAFQGGSIPDVDAYRTPLGLIQLSPTAKKLAKVRPFVTNPPCRVRRPAWSVQSPKTAPPFGEDTPHTWEHSLEVQLPFLQRVLKDFTIIPVLFGLVDEEKAAQALMDYIDGETLLVASSDLSHYYPYEVARQKDSSCTKAICDLDIEKMKGEEACGRSPILTLMYIAKKKGWKTKLLDYRNSGDTSGDRSAVVGYAAIVFFEPEKPENPVR